MTLSPTRVIGPGRLVGPVPANPLGHFLTSKGANPMCAKSGTLGALGCRILHKPHQRGSLLAVFTSERSTSATLHAWAMQPRGV